MNVTALTKEIKERAFALGFHAVGVSDVGPWQLEARRLSNWIEGGSAARLDYVTKTQDLRARPEGLLEGARSLLSLAVSYYSGEFDPLPEGHGRVARYAWGRDYHEVIPPKLSQLVREAERIAGRSITARWFTDAVPLLERAAARRAAVGRVGLNTLLITDRFGSWVFLADILWDLELERDARDDRACMSTQDCIRRCPTNAITPYRVDAGRCISYHTIENRGVIDRALRRNFGDWLFGCDVCQEVCPHNHHVPSTDWTEFHPKAGVGQSLPLQEVLSIADDDSYRQRFAGTALLRTGRRGLVRNACIVAANLKYEPAIPNIKSLARSDSDPVVRAHAIGALGEFDVHLHRDLIEKGLHDPAEEVRAESDSALTAHNL